MSELAERLRACLDHIRACEARYGRERGSASLIAVSKRHSTDAIRAAYAAGQRAFGENYLAEALDKQAALAELDIEWHFIGSIQSNKSAAIARAFDWVHTVAREKIARRLNDQRPPRLAALNVTIQVNISGEASKDGVAPDALPALIDYVRALPRLHLRGLMALPAPEPDPVRQRLAFARLAALAAAADPPLHTLSMGTSDDFEAAIAEGATLIRIGTAIFGPRADAA